jgi:hypothetical protein
MATTTNYGWDTPDDTDLVKDGAAAIRTLGSSIDTTTKNLNPETTLGDIAYRSATANTNTRLPIGSNGQILGVSAGVPAWINNDQGDITEVQAGTGISVASGTGPIPVVTNTMATAIDAKGDLVVGTGADTFSRLAVGGTNGHTLQVDSSTSTGLKWAAPAGGGKVLQVVQGTFSTNTTSSSSTLVDTGLTQAITPSSATSKILCLVNVDGVAKNAQNAGNAVRFSVLRGATEIAATYHTGYTNSTLVNVVGSWSSIILDSPATTSATTYKVQFANNNNGASIEINYYGNTSTITLLEIGA